MKHLLMSGFLVLAQAPLALPALAQGPFGIAMGTPLAQLDLAEEGLRPILNSVPKPHPSFETYAAWGSPETGVCALIALSRPFENDRSGRIIRDAFAGLRKALDAKYGPHAMIDIHAGGIWTDADEWVMSIRQNERFYAAEWTSPGAGDSTLEHVELQVQALSSDTSVLKIYYQSTQFDTCEAAIEAGDNSSL